MSTTAGVLRIKSFAHGEVAQANMELKQETLPSLEPGHVLLKNLYLSVDPTHRLYISGAETYLPPFKLGDKMLAFVLGEVLQSTSDKWHVGDKVVAVSAWETHSVVTEGYCFTKIDPNSKVPLDGYLAVMSAIIGLTAWHGVRKILQAKEGQTIVVSGAAGAVGSLAVQLAKKAGARVIGICGDAAKCDFLKQIGADGAINYKTDNVSAKLKELCPKGVDGYYENVGGEITEAVLDQMTQYGRVALCGLISHYNKEGGEFGQMRVWPQMLCKRLMVQGFICLDHLDEAAEAFTELGGMLESGQLKYKSHIFSGGLEKCIEGLQALTRGTNTGKVIVQLQ
eukprot:GDKI01043965.1.p1 GENE.GDKI01043965.1~~GDKI01043965.1.p1  ORF type:complete len:339 (-),score=125.08 GDKI01043965.1:214-1230(-)